MLYHNNFSAYSVARQSAAGVSLIRMWRLASQGRSRILPRTGPLLITSSRRVTSWCFDADLVHAGSLNHSGARRRSILISYLAEPLYASHLQTRALRGVSMDCQERFEPADFPWPGA